MMNAPARALSGRAVPPVSSGVGRSQQPDIATHTHDGVGNELVKRNVGGIHVVDGGRVCRERNDSHRIRRNR